MPQENKYGGVSTSIYFTKAELFSRIENLAKVCNVSTSKIIESVFDSAIGELERKAPKDRVFKIDLLVRI